MENLTSIKRAYNVRYDFPYFQKILSEFTKTALSTVFELFLMAKQVCTVLMTCSAVKPLKILTTCFTTKMQFSMKRQPLVVLLA